MTSAGIVFEVDLVILLAPGLPGPQAPFPREFKTCMVEVMRETHSFVNDIKREEVHSKLGSM